MRLYNGPANTDVYDDEDRDADDDDIENNEGIDRKSMCTCI